MILRAFRPWRCHRQGHAVIARVRAAVERPVVLIYQDSLDAGGEGTIRCQVSVYLIAPFPQAVTYPAGDPALQVDDLLLTIDAGCRHCIQNRHAVVYDIEYSLQDGPHD